MTEEQKTKIAEMVKDRDEALLSLDEKKIRAYAAKYGVTMPTGWHSFWGGVHKAR